jgi:hypothetical protein
VADIVTPMKPVPRLLCALLLAASPVLPEGHGDGFSEATKTPEGLIRALYDMVSFDAGPEPDWEMFRDVFLEDAILVFSPMGDRPMRPMGVDGFIQDWKEFFRDYELADKGFYETIAGVEITEFGGLAHAFVIFEPRIGKEVPARQLRGLDSIELAFDGERWWVAAITTDFETPDKPIPPGIGDPSPPDSGDPE